MTTANIRITFALAVLIVLALVISFYKINQRRSFQLSVFLEELNQALISSSDIQNLSLAIMEVLDKFIQPAHSKLILKDSSFKVTVDSKSRTSSKTASIKVPVEVAKYHSQEGDRLVYKYALPSKYRNLKQLLDNNAVTIALDLTNSLTNSSSPKVTSPLENFAILLLGPKKDGKSYTKKDLEALRLVSKELVIALQNSLRFEEIKSFNEKLQKRIDDATKKLKLQNKKLMETDELKDDFLSIASHQMRTPISAINGYASMLSSGDAGQLNKQQDKFTDTIQNNTRKLSYLINDFLDISRLKSGKFQIEKRPTDLNKVLLSEVQNMRNQFKDKNISFKVQNDPSLPSVKTDEQKIRQVISNLIDNALCYTKKGGSVSITLKRSRDKIVFEIMDSGIGVPKQDHHKLFDKMFRASNAETIRPDGNGLGLYLTKKVILGHRGNLIFKSQEGVGSTFGFSIPIK